MPHMHKILDLIWQSGLQITKMKMTLLDRAEGNEFYKDLHAHKSY